MNPCVQWLFDRVDYERTASMPSGDGLKLDRMRELCERLGSPQRGLPAVHITGTKGKGSTAVLVAEAARLGGFRVGLFTSPHLQRLEERVCIDGQPCDEHHLAAGLAAIRPHVEQMDRSAGRIPGGHGPTFFEILTAFAFAHFQACRVDLAVLEVGLGGRLDSTNVCEPLTTAITSISLDHTKQLGSTVEAIAWEKSGIIKSGIPVVCGPLSAGPLGVVRRRADQLSAPIYHCDEAFTFDYRPGRLQENRPALIRVEYVRPQHETLLDWTPLQLAGRHQAANAAVAAMICRLLCDAGRPIQPAAAKRALAQVQYPARIEVVARQPWVIIDGAHNPASMAALAAFIREQFPSAHRTLVFAAANDKDAAGMLREAQGTFDETFLTQFTNNPRATPLCQLADVAAPILGRCPTFDDPHRAIEAARQRAGSDDLICIAGSFYLAAELRPRLIGNPAGTND